MDKGIVQGFKEYHSVTDVEFVVKLTSEGVAALSDTSVETLFKLRRAFSTNNVLCLYRELSFVVVCMCHAPTFCRLYRCRLVVSVFPFPVLCYCRGA